MSMRVLRRPRSISGRLGHVLGSERSARGQSLTVFAVVIMAALIMTTGLVIDGGQKAAAISRAEAVAAVAARVGSEAGAAGSVAGQADSGTALAAARSYLDSSQGVAGSATILDGRVSVHTEVHIDTIFLSVIGIDELTGTGDASSELIGSGRR